MGLLHLAARHGRLCLVAGLLAGLALPQVAAAMRPWLPHLVAFLLFLTALRVGPRAILGGAEAGARPLVLVIALQLALPLGALALFGATGLLDSPLALAVVLMLSAPSVTGAPNFAIMNGHDPVPAMRVLVLGTALFPLTVLPVLWLLPIDAGAGAAVLRLVVVILGAVGGGLALRGLMRGELAPARTAALDGLAAIALAVIVVGLMSAIGPLLRSDPVRLAGWLALVLALNFGLQVMALALLRRRMPRSAVPVSIVAGNRNIALFLVALPATTTDALLIFIGCYQIPMYLTPLLMRPLHDRARPA